jgi:DNA polymerase-1
MEHLALVDGSGYIHRAYHALPKLTRRADGAHVGAVSGFSWMLWRMLKEFDRFGFGMRPSHLAVILDCRSKTARHHLYPAYKANRPPMDMELSGQFGLVERAIEAFNVACVKEEGIEADDLIATYARQARERGMEVTIFSGDKDFMQLVRPGVGLYDPIKEKHIGVEQVLEKFGVHPEFVVDVQALLGDTADNVPGVPGIGPKSAPLLIRQFGSLEDVLYAATVGDITAKKQAENLIAFASDARISKALVTLDEDAMTWTDIDEMAVRPPRRSMLLPFLEEMEFVELRKRIRI